MHNVAVAMQNLIAEVPSSPIQTILSVPELHQVHRPATLCNMQRDAGTGHGLTGWNS